MLSVADFPIKHNDSKDYFQPMLNKSFTEKPLWDSYLLDYGSRKSSYVAESNFKSRKSINVFLNGQIIASLPNDLDYLLFNIEKSKAILLLEDDWDDEGSEKYDENTWVQAIKFLVDYAKTLYFDFNIQVDIPKIYEGPKGSVDIIWEVEKYRLVVNINKNGEDAAFYADNYKNQRTEGVFKIREYNRFLLPIATQI